MFCAGTYSSSYKSSLSSSSSSSSSSSTSSSAYSSHKDIETKASSTAKNKNVFTFVQHATKAYVNQIKRKQKKRKTRSKKKIKEKKDIFYV